MNELVFEDYFNVLFGQVKDYFVVTNFQIGGAK
jgi:hypothetical protein